VTGLNKSSGSEREFTLEGRWYADEEIQAGADRGSDREITAVAKQEETLTIQLGALKSVYKSINRYDVTAFINNEFSDSDKEKRFLPGDWIIKLDVRAEHIFFRSRMKVYRNLRTTL
jgi:hypothetical protein